MHWAVYVCSRGAFTQPQSHWSGFSQLEDRVICIAGFVRHLVLAAEWECQPPAFVQVDD